MRAVVITEPGGPEVLQVQDVPDPTPKPDEVVIDVAATAINRADLLQRQGNYPPPPGASPYLGMECSGTIAALGDAVAGWEVGDEVCALLAGGGYAEKVAAPVGQLLHIPAGVGLVDAAALPEAACTVWSMLFGTGAGRLQPGERLLVHGGSSGIGTIAIQVAHGRGAIVFATAGTPRKVEFCRKLGAEVAINYRDEVFDARIERDTAGQGVDVILDNMGASYLDKNISALAMDGRLVNIGMQGGVKAELNIGKLMAKRASVYSAGLRARTLEEKAAIVTDVRERLWPLVEQGSVKPIVGQVFPLAEAADAHRALEDGTVFGKILLAAKG
jgi:putative PIG3 family NAD(P)H quinone oxidoreductase